MTAGLTVASTLYVSGCCNRGSGISVLSPRTTMRVTNKSVMVIANNPMHKGELLTSRYLQTLRRRPDYYPQ